MKKLFYAFMPVLLIIMATTNESNAQKYTGNLQADALVSTNTTPIDKKSAASKEADNDAINPKALRHFHKSYKMAEEVKWMQLKDGFMARFEHNGISERVYYQPNGNLAGTLKGYAADKMPGEIHSMIKTSYAGYLITYVDEAEIVSMPGTPAYFVHLQGNEDLKVVKICDGEMYVMLDTEKKLKGQ